MIQSSATMWRHTFSMRVMLEKGSIVLSGILSGSGTYGEERIEKFGRKNGGGEEILSTNVYTEDKSWGLEIKEFGDDIMLNRKVENGSSLDAFYAMELITEIYNSDERWQKSQRDTNADLNDQMHTVIGAKEGA